MTLSQVTLECFDDGEGAAPQQSAEFKRGFEAGVAAMKEADTAKQAEATSAVSSTLADMRFGYAEARLALLDRIRPLLVQVAEAVLPEVVQDTFSLHLVDTLMRDFETLTGQPVQIAVSPAAVEPLKASLRDLSDDFVFVPDANLIDGQAVVKSAQRQIMIDLPALMLALQTALCGLDSLERTRTHG